jgi:hypothetical protein
MKIRRLRMIVARIANAAFWFTSGGYALALYIEATNRAFPQIRDLRHHIWLAWLVLLIVSGLLRSGRRGWNMPEPSPARSGTAVVVVTGAAGIAFVLGNNPDTAGMTLAAGIAGVTLVAAWLMYRFASRNAAQIGEARFDTSGTAGVPTGPGTDVSHA